MSWSAPKNLKSRLLFVEGKDEVNFFKALAEHMQSPELQIIDVGGKYSFRTNLSVIMKMTDFEQVQSIGIIHDADDSPEISFQGLCTTLEALNLPVPRNVLTWAKGNPQVGILIVPPDNEGTGRMLEDLCLASMRNDPAMSCVDDYLECLSRQAIILRENVIAKAKLHAFLASRSEPDKRLGEAAQANYWDWSSPVFDKVKMFLQMVASH